MPVFDLSLPELERYRPEADDPADFDAFWADTLAEARAHDVPVTRRPADTPLRVLHAEDVTFPGFGGEPVSAWFVRPAAVDGPLPVVVEFLGYGGGRGFAADRLGWAGAGYAHLVVDTRGQGSVWGNGGATPDPHGTGPSVPGFLTRGIDHRDTYYYRRLFTDAARAVDAVRTLPEVDPDRVVVTGTSQGGGTALAAAGLSDGLAAVLPDVPFLCHWSRALDLAPGDPYGELVRYLAVHRGAPASVLATLAYFDGVAFARRASAPALFSTALMDTVCPPSTVFAAYNHYAHADREIAVYPYNGHEGGLAHQWARQTRFLADRGIAPA